MDPDSPLQKKLLKRSRKHILYSSDEEQYGRNSDTADIHCNCVPSSSSPSCHSQNRGATPSDKEGGTKETSQNHGRGSNDTVIKMVSLNPEPWDSEVDTNASSDDDTVLKETTTHRQERAQAAHQVLELESDSEESSSGRSSTSTPAYKRGRHDDSMDRAAVAAIQ